MNHAYLAMAWKYQLAILPARIRRPKDKASVESGVGFIERNLLMEVRLELEKQQFESLEALNARIRELLDKYSREPFQKRSGSRMSVYLEVDKPALRPLPKEMEEIFETKEVKAISNDYLVKYDRFYYSVPYRYIGQAAYIHAYKNKIEIVLKETRELIAFHPRHYEGSVTVMKLEHMPENHRAYLEFQHLKGDDYRRMALSKGKYVHTLICDILQSGPAEEHTFRECYGILKLGEKYGAGKLNSACRKALEAYSVSYSTVKTILKGGTSGDAEASVEGHQASDEVDHENIRNDWR